jgi:DNA-binding LacI/PurR family transcriptional regulator
LAKQATLKQIAAQAGVSFQTVSKVLNHKARVSKETEERIRNAARQLGYRPNYSARNLRLQRSRQLGYSWRPTSPDQVNPILDEFLRSMLRAAESAGYHILCFSYQQDEQQLELYRQLIDANQVDAFILSGVEYDDARISFLRQVNFPFAAFGRSNPHWDFPCVDLDGALGMRMLLEHLLANGHRSIAAIAFPHNSRVGQNRMEGFSAAMTHAGLPLLDANILRGAGTFQFGYQAARQLLQRPQAQRPSALVAFNDVMAIGAMQAARELGVALGKELAVTGYDDTPMLAYLAPPLTSVSQPVAQIGKGLVDMLVGILNGDADLQTQVLLDPELVIRQSSDFIFTSQSGA